MTVSPYSLYLEREFLKQVKLMAQNRDVVEPFGIYRDYVNVELKNQVIITDPQPENNKRMESYVNALIPLVNVHNVETFKEVISRGLIIHYINQYKNSINLNEIVPLKIVLEIIQKLSESSRGKKGIEKLKDFTNAVYEFEVDQHDGSLGVDSTLDAYNRFVDYFESLEFADNAFSNYGYTGRFKIGIDRNRDCDFNGLMSFYDVYSKIPEKEALLKFNWGLSSGEMTILSLFSRLYSLCEKELMNNLIILLDEAEVTLHPEWQRQFVFVFEKAIHIMFGNKNVQVIMSTHSPIVLSDIPSKDIVFLNSRKTEICNESRVITEACNKRSESFCANIYEIYRDSYFLRSFVGEKAIQTVNSILKVIHSVAKGEEYFSQAQYKEKCRLSSIIGDDLLKVEIENMIKEIEENKNDTNISK